MLTVQKKIIEEMLTKENDHGTKVKDVESMNKNEIGKLNKDICRLKKKTENVQGK